MQYYAFRNLLTAAALTAMAVSFTSCSDDDDPVTPPEPEVEASTMFVLNEGQMGMNNSSIDMLNLDNGTYTQNAYELANPTTVLELGDVGNDIVVAGEKVYAVINSSHKVEVIDANTCKRIGQIGVNSPRYATVAGDYLYVSSWVGGASNQGSVVKIDLSTDKVVAAVGVGIHPEEMAVLNGKLYVTSSQDYTTGEFDDRLVVVDLATFTAESVIHAGINQTQIKAADNGMLYVVSAGNYADVTSSIYVIDPMSPTNIKHLEMPATKLALYKDKGYVLASVYDANWNATYTISQFDLGTFTASEMNLQGFDRIETPYSIAVDPNTGTFYVGDARDYTSTGRVYAFNLTTGALLNSYNAGVLPGHFCFYQKIK